MTEYRIATVEDMELLMESRLEMLKVVNNLPEDHVFPDLIIEESETVTRLPCLHLLTEGSPAALRSVT